jgi:hypothetical protein
MKNGDVCAIEIDGIGTLRNPIADEASGGQRGTWIGASRRPGAPCPRIVGGHAAPPL